MAESNKDKSKVKAGLIGAIIGTIIAIIVALIIVNCQNKRNQDNNDNGTKPSITEKPSEETQPVEPKPPEPTPPDPKPPEPQPQKSALNFRGWYVWGGLQASANKNTVTLNGRVSSAGYVNEHLDTELRNKTIILEFTDISSSNYNEDRMIKITVNSNDQLVRPLGITDLIQGEYIPIDYDQVEFVLPNNFDGKIGFVFFDANLRNLKITAFYK